MKRFLHIGYLLVLTILISGLLASCAKKASERKNLSGTNPDASSNPEENQDTQYAFDAASIECSDIQSCNHSLGLVVANFGSKLEYCTGFLLSKDVFMTSSRCIPNQVLSDPNTCSDKIKILFPDTGVYSKTNVNCGKVMEIVNGNKRTGLGIDYVILKLAKPVQRERLELTREGLESKTKLYHYRIDIEDETKTHAVIHMQQCTAVQNSYTFSFYNENLSPIVSFGDCEIKSSHTGSPLIDERGVVRAMVVADSVLTLGEVAHKILKPTEAFKPLSFAVNAACVPNPASTEPYEIDQICNKIVALEDLENAQAALVDNTDKQALTLFKEQLNKTIEPEIKAFTWKGTVLSDSVGPINGESKPLIFPIPDCYNKNKSSEWLKEYDMLWGLGFYKKKAKRSYKLPVYKLSVEFDEYRVPYIKGREVETLETEVEFSPRYAHKEKRSPLRVKVKLPNTGNEIVIYDKSFEKCN